METSKLLPSIVHIKWENLCLNEKVCADRQFSCRKFPIIVEGYFFRKVRSSYSLLSIYSEEIFFCKKKVLCKPLSFVMEVSNNSRGQNYRKFLKTPAKEYEKCPIIVGGFFEKVRWNTPTKRWKLSNISRGYFQELTKNTPTNRQANVHI